ncbi:HU family DNA-binding protein [Fusobacterium varium]|jgi:integration host factor subunit alpha|uniref:Methionine ABC transporter ATP-binding protein n=1 Tax=Fusobacterium varium ATCC 27725 TaxID=469618 RepID=A0ABN5JIZ4_FUSVA|nr:HU family DNA-binding protein [Fusobacterium varium]AVQ32138.1 methionine ABC transporter ATP-binding protein [Fusobacterium varium ATCC 27725]EES63507.2 DNA-binding protein HU [Fusobacterium varium ATCC 27725]MCF2673688.1 HU family DNA-binding protein [Fusobacterium varium]MCI6032661.1 HU family DNA-binding protein [Fusobacterium varium]MDY4006691.1 HU family DNA-binding protein [Fusobacterium varium]
MTEREFLSLYQKKRGLKSFNEAKEKVNMFWDTLFEALKENESVSFRGWGVFEKKVVPARRIMNINTKKIQYSTPRKTVRFRTGSNLSLRINDEKKLTK